MPHTSVVGVYAGGSYALGAYEQGRSDVDLAIVVDAPLADATKQSLVEALRHESLPCPARGLELVVYDRAAAGSPTAVAAFELNLNTGKEMAFLAQFTPDQDQSHWFVLDRSILREHAVTLAGPSPQNVFGLIPYQVLLGALTSSLKWHVRGEARADDSVLNACRSLRYARTRVWSAKEAAADWAIEQAADADTVLAALRERAGGPPVRSQQATAFVATIEREIEQLKHVREPNTAGFCCHVRERYPALGQQTIKSGRV